MSTIYLQGFSCRPRINRNVYRNIIFKWLKCFYWSTVFIVGKHYWELRTCSDSLNLPRIVPSRSRRNIQSWKKLKLIAGVWFRCLLITQTKQPASDERTNRPTTRATKHQTNQTIIAQHSNTLASRPHAWLLSVSFVAHPNFELPAFLSLLAAATLTTPRRQKRSKGHKPRVKVFGITWNSWKQSSQTFRDFAFFCTPAYLSAARSILKPTLTKCEQQCLLNAWS